MNCCPHFERNHTLNPKLGHWSIRIKLYSWSSLASNYTLGYAKIIGIHAGLTCKSEVFKTWHL